MSATRFVLVALVLAAVACEGSESRSDQAATSLPTYERPAGMSDQCWSYCDPYVSCVEETHGRVEPDFRQGCTEWCDIFEPYAADCAVEVERYFRCEGQSWENRCGVAAYSDDCGDDWYGDLVACIIDSTTSCTQGDGECGCTGTHPRVGPVTVTCYEVAAEGGGGGASATGSVQCACGDPASPDSLCSQDELSCGIVGSCCMPTPL